MRADCITLHQVYRRIKSLKLTGNFDEDDIYRMSLVEYSSRTQVLGHIYGIGNIQTINSKISSSFGAVYGFLTSRTNLVSGTPMQQESGGTNKNKIDRTVGNKKSKQARVDVIKSKGAMCEERTIQESDHEISVAVRKNGEILEARSKLKAYIDIYKLTFEQEKYWMKQAGSLLSPTSGASSEERKKVASFIRKLTLLSLSKIIDAEGTEDDRNLSVLDKKSCSWTSSGSDIETQPPTPMTQHETQIDLNDDDDDNVTASPFV